MRAERWCDLTGRGRRKVTLVSQAINLPVHEIPDFFEIRDVNTVLRMHGSVAGLERDAGPDACEKGV
ncbi:MAG: hypothetical protein ACTHJY_22490, partial [Rhizobiaceae bacterium]